MSEVQYVERMILRVDGVDLDDVINSVEEGGETNGKYVNVMNKRRRPRGIKQGNSTFDLNIEAERIDDPRIPDWYALMLARKTIQVVTEPNVGAAFTYTGRIVTVKDTTSDGDSKRSIKMMCWDRI